MSPELGGFVQYLPAVKLIPSLLFAAPASETCVSVIVSYGKLTVSWVAISFLQKGFRLTSILIEFGF